MKPKPGWYEDADGSGERRYWDGRRWTNGPAPEPPNAASPVTYRRPKPSRALLIVAGTAVLVAVAAVAITLANRPRYHFTEPADDTWCELAREMYSWHQEVDRLEGEVLADSDGIGDSIVNFQRKEELSGQAGAWGRYSEAAEELLDDAPDDIADDVAYFDTKSRDEYSSDDTGDPDEYVTRNERLTAYFDQVCGLEDYRGAMLQGALIYYYKYRT